MSISFTDRDKWLRNSRRVISALNILGYSFERIAATFNGFTGYAFTPAEIEQELLVHRMFEDFVSEHESDPRPSDQVVERSEIPKGRSGTKCSRQERSEATAGSLGLQRTHQLARDVHTTLTVPH